MLALASEFNKMSRQSAPNSEKKCLVFLTSPRREINFCWGLKGNKLLLGIEGYLGDIDEILLMLRVPREDMKAKMGLNRKASKNWREQRGSW